MRLREALRHAKAVANKLPKNSKCAKEHQQLAGWLEELIVYRRIIEPYKRISLNHARG
jgi:hypothetical protein